MRPKNDNQEANKVDMIELLKAAVNHKASDLHLSAGLPPVIRIDGDIQPLKLPPLENKVLQALMYSVMNEKQQKNYAENLEIDFSFEVPELGRFRVNVFTSQRGMGAAFRIISEQVLSLEALDAPSIFKEIAEKPRGLVLVTGPTGSGKSTTLAAMIDYINSTQPNHIITIEDPIEFIHPCKKSLIHQREVFRDTHSFAAALRSALREDPDIILLGEMRDLETIRLSLTAAETGHLVFGTLHTATAAKAIDRIIDVFPGDEKEMVRTMLSESLHAVIAQTLLKKRIGGRIAAHEIMICTPAIRNLIRESKIAQIYSTIQTGRGHGMQTLDQNLQALLQKNLITPQEARSYSDYKL